MTDNEKSGKTNYEYFENKLPNRTYISKSIPIKDEITDEERFLKIVSKPIKWELEIDNVIKEWEEVLRITPKNNQEIIAKVYTDTKSFYCVTIKRYWKWSNKEEHFSFYWEEIKTLRNFLDSIKYLDLWEPRWTRIEDEDLEKMRNLILETADNTNCDFLIDIVENKLTKKDVTAVAYRKKELEEFRLLLEDDEFFSNKKKELGKWNEWVWQDFFERNTWIFWYWLWFLFNEPLNDKKLEQVVCGYDITTNWKRADWVLKSKGVISAFCLVEIKHDKTPLLAQTTNAYRPWVWVPSDELSWWIVQSQKTVQKSVENIWICFNWKDENWNPTWEKIYNYLPKSYLVIWNLKEFMTENWINEDKYSSFELYRKNIHNPEIITFDELYERAKFIVYWNKKFEETKIQNEKLLDDELPF